MGWVEHVAQMEMKMRTKFWLRILKETDKHGRCGRLLKDDIKLYLREIALKDVLDSSGSCKHCTERSGSVNGGRFLG